MERTDGQPCSSHMASRYTSLISEVEKDNSKRHNPNKNNYAGRLHLAKNLNMFKDVY